MLFAVPALNSIASLALVAIGIGLVLFVIMTVGKLMLKIIVGLILNMLLGFVALFLVGWAFGISIALTLPIIAAIVIFGLPAVGTMLLLKLFGGAALAAAL